MLNWLIEKEGMPTVIHDLKQPVPIIFADHCYTTPMACLVKHFYIDMCVPLMKVLIEHGEDINRKVNGITPLETLCQFCENNVQFYSESHVTITPEYIYMPPNRILTKLGEILDLFIEQNVDMEEYSDRFIKFQQRIAPKAVIKQVLKGGSKLDYCTVC